MSKVKIKSDGADLYLLTSRAKYYGVKEGDELDVITGSVGGTITVSKKGGYQFTLLAGEYEEVKK